MTVSNEIRRPEVGLGAHPDAERERTEEGQQSGGLRACDSRKRELKCGPGQRGHRRGHAQLDST